METVSSVSLGSAMARASLEPLGPPSGEAEAEPEPEPRADRGSEASPEPPEPPLLRIRPSSVQSQDISHVLTNLFRNLYTLDVIGEDIGANLIKSRGGENPQHETFVAELQKLRYEYAQKLADADVVERHIIQARARAMAEEERVLNNIKAQGFKTIQLPPVKSTFRWCVDNELLRKNHLICPDDYTCDPLSFSRAPKGENESEYSKLTFSYKQHIAGTEDVQKVTEMVRKKKLPAIPSQVSLSTLTKCSTPEVTPPKVVKKFHFPKNKMWMSHLNTTQRVQERRRLTQFENQHNFLKNPRFFPPNTTSGGKSLLFPPPKIGPRGDERSAEFSERNFDDTPVFLAKPAVGFFTDYVVGPVYEIVLELQNMTSTSRHLRVLPPSTQYFSLGLVLASLMTPSISPQAGDAWTSNPVTIPGVLGTEATSLRAICSQEYMEPPGASPESQSPDPHELLVWGLEIQKLVFV